VLNGIVAADRVRLNVARWPAGEPASGTLLIVHGLGEHIGRFGRFASRLNAWGWHVVGYDQRGHGASDGARGALPHAAALLDDLALAVDAVKASLPAPLVLFGDSMGGLIAARLVASERADRWRREVDGLVLASPALDPGMNAAQKLLLAVLSPLAPDLAVSSGLKPESISRDPAVVAAYRDDPLVHDRVTARLVRFIVDAGVHVRERASQWTVPTLHVWAGADRCVAPGGSRDFARAAPRHVVQSHEFPALYHEVFNEPEKDDVYGLLRRWLAALGR